MKRKKLIEYIKKCIKKDIAKGIPYIDRLDVIGYLFLYKKLQEGLITNKIMKKKWRSNKNRKKLINELLKLVPIDY